VTDSITDITDSKSPSLVHFGILLAVGLIQTHDSYCQILFLAFFMGSRNIVMQRLILI